MFYPVRFDEAEDGVDVNIRDLGVSLTYPDIQQARERTASDIVQQMETKFRKKKLPIPKPSRPLEGEEVFYIPLKIQSRIILWNEMMHRHMRIIDLAKLLNTSPAQAQRYVNGSNDVSIESYEKALLRLNMWPKLKVH